MRSLGRLLFAAQVMSILRLRLTAFESQRVDLLYVALFTFEVVIALLVFEPLRIHNH